MELRKNLNRCAPGHVTVWVLSTFMGSTLASAANPAPGVDSVPFTVNSETAALQISRSDFVAGEDVLVRSFHRSEKDRGLFGAGWCSNIDLRLNGIEGSLREASSTLELKVCGVEKPRVFHKVSDAWVEDGLPSRILRKPDGRWELTEYPFPIFSQDGKLESFTVPDQTRWYVRRDSTGRAEALDSMSSSAKRGRAVQIRRNLSGDVESLATGGKILVKYSFGSVLESLESVIRYDSNQKPIREERYEYDGNGNIVRLIIRENGAVRLWKLSYANPGWLSMAQGPDGCTRKWIFERLDSSEKPTVSETKVCQSLEAQKSAELAGAVAVKSGKPEAAKAKVSSNATGSLAVQVNGSDSAVRTVRKKGPMGLGTETAQVTLNDSGQPIVFEIVGTDSKKRRLEIQREPKTNSVIAVIWSQKSKPSNPLVIPIRDKPRSYTNKQLDGLDDYESWMGAWTNRN